MSGRDHYQRAFEEYVRQRRLPYVSVDEARRALLPQATSPAVQPSTSADSQAAPTPASTLKSFDFVVYGTCSNLLVEVKGRKIARRRPARPVSDARDAAQARAPRPKPADWLPGLAAPPRTRLESWITRDDVDSLRTWETLFGRGFVAVFAFVYWCEDMAPSALFEEYVERDGRWYAVRCITRTSYEGAMRTRSPRWGTVHIPPDAFERLSRPLSAAIGQ